jgi:membrane associated rhomboid family serine protease
MLLFTGGYLYTMAAYQQFRPGSSVPPVTLNLIIMNVVVFLAQMALDPTIGLTNKLMLYPVVDSHFRAYQIITHMFAHGGFAHIFFNMFGLYMFGKILENFWGPKKFLFFYLVCGLGAAACHMAVQYFRYTQVVELSNSGEMERAIALYQTLGPALGASGAIMGIFVAFGYLFPNTELLLLFFPVPIKAKWLVIGLVAIDLFGGFGNIEGDNVAHWAHLGGALAGFLLVYFWNRNNRRTFY